MEPNKMPTFKSTLELEVSEILSRLSEVLQKHNTSDISGIQLPLEVEVKISNIEGLSIPPNAKEEVNKISSTTFYCIGNSTIGWNCRRKSPQENV